MSIADRAVAAYEAEKEAVRLEKEAAELRGREEASRIISEEASRLGIPVDTRNLKGGTVLGWNLKAKLDDDTSITFVYRHSKYDPAEIEMRVSVCDQLYWDLPPGQEKKERGGGTYGCYSLSNVNGKRVSTLSEIGEAVTKVREARQSWRKKHLRT